MAEKRVQINPGDAGTYDVVEGTRLGLDREYPDWKSPRGTHMVPDLFPSDQRDKGKIAEESVYNLLQRCGTQRKEPMFVVHSCPFSEHIPDSKRQKSWVMGETDIVIIHKIHGPIYIEVKATETGKSFKEAEEQLQKGKLALQKHFEKAVKGEIKTRKVIEIFKNLPAFVAMPNCPRPSEVCALKANALYKEDCSSLEGFDKWWNDNIVTAKHPAVDQKIYEDLVIW